MKKVGSVFSLLLLVAEEVREGQGVRADLPGIQPLPELLFISPGSFILHLQAQRPSSPLLQLPPWSHWWLGTEVGVELEFSSWACPLYLKTYLEVFQRNQFKDR